VLGALLATALLAGCGGGGGGGGSQPSGRDAFYGVIAPEPPPSAALLDTLGRGRVGTVRINLAWAYVQSGPGADYDWSHYDPIIAGAARNNIRVLITVYSSPTWAEPSAETPPLGDALPGFEAFVRAAAGRYGSGGSFWSDHTDLPKLPVTDWQLWNEPNSPIFWKPAPDAAQYATLLRAFHDAVAASDPDAQILLGGLFPSPAGGIPMADFLAQLHRDGAGGEFDAAAIHPYASNPRQALGRVVQLRAALRAVGPGSKPIWVTEVGWASAGRPSGVTVGPARQAAYLTQTFRLAASQRERLGIAGVLWYALIDTPGPIWINNCGLFDLDGSPKPAWESFVRQTGGAS
jgi:polysaccharide biosynthesis protein PslG